MSEPQLVCFRRGKTGRQANVHHSCSFPLLGMSQINPSLVSLVTIWQHDLRSHKSFKTASVTETLEQGRQKSPSFLFYERLYSSVVQYDRNYTLLNLWILFHMRTWWWQREEWIVFLPGVNTFFSSATCKSERYLRGNTFLRAGI